MTRLRVLTYALGVLTVAGCQDPRRADGRLAATTFDNPHLLASEVEGGAADCCPLPRPKLGPVGADGDAPLSAGNLPR